VFGGEVGDTVMCKPTIQLPWCRSGASIRERGEVGNLTEKGGGGRKEARGQKRKKSKAHCWSRGAQPNKKLITRVSHYNRVGEGRKRGGTGLTTHGDAEKKRVHEGKGKSAGSRRDQKTSTLKQDKNETSLLKPRSETVTNAD